MRAYTPRCGVRWHVPVWLSQAYGAPLMQIEVTAEPSASDREAVLSGLHAFMRAGTGEVPVRLAALCATTPA